MLSRYQNTTSKYRRVTNELKNYNELQNDFFLIENHITTNNVLKDVEYTIFGKFFNNNDKHLAIIKFEYPINYPFKSPTIKINGHNYKDLLVMESKWLEKFNIDKCLCCNSLLCKWCPQVRLTDMLNEIKENMTLKIRISEIQLAKQVVKNIFGFYLPIEEFL